MASFEDLIEGLTPDDFAPELVQRLGDTISRNWWPAWAFRDYFAQRPAQEVLSSGSVPVLGPCIPITLVAFECIKRLGLEPKLIIEETRHEDASRRPYRLHASIEYVQDGKLTSLDYMKENTWYRRLGEHFMYGAHDLLETVTTYVLGSDQVRPNMPLHEMLGLRSIYEVDKSGLFKGYSLESQLNQLDAFIGSVGDKEAFLERAKAHLPFIIAEVSEDERPESAPERVLYTPDLLLPQHL